MQHILAHHPRLVNRFSAKSKNSPPPNPRRASHPPARIPTPTRPPLPPTPKPAKIPPTSNPARPNNAILPSLRNATPHPKRPRRNRGNHRTMHPSRPNGLRRRMVRRTPLPNHLLPIPLPRSNPRRPRPPHQTHPPRLRRRHPPLPPPHPCRRAHRHRRPPLPRPRRIRHRTLRTLRTTRHGHRPPRHPRNVGRIPNYDPPNLAIRLLPMERQILESPTHAKSSPNPTKNPTPPSGSPPSSPPPTKSPPKKASAPWR